MRSTRSVLKGYLLLLIWALFSLNVGRTFSSNNVPFLSVLLIGIVFAVLLMPIWVKKFFIDRALVFYSVFVAFSFLSYFWAENKDAAISGSLVVLLTLLILFVYYLVIRVSHIHVYSLLGFYCIAALLTYIYLVGRYGISITWSLRNSSFTGSDLYNANAVGKLYLIGAACGYMRAKSNTRNQRFFLTLSILLLVLMILTASKTNVITLFLMVFIYMYLKRRGSGQKAFVLLLIPILVFAAYYLIMYVPALYNLIGNRFVEVFDLFSGNIEKYSSTWYRMSMYQNGFNLFLKKPFFGYGMTNAAQHNVYEWVYEQGVYLHSNYLELLVDVGLIGTILYYAMYYYAIKENLKGYRRNDAISMLFIAFVISTMITDISFVSYLNRPTVLLIFTACLYGRNFLDTSGIDNNDGGIV